MALVFREWDVDKLEAELPPCMLYEWNEHFLWEIEQISQAIAGALPMAISQEEPTKVITDPEEIALALDSLGFKNGLKKT